MVLKSLGIPVRRSPAVKPRRSGAGWLLPLPGLIVVLLAPVGVVADRRAQRAEQLRAAGAACRAVAAAVPAVPEDPAPWRREKYPEVPPPAPASEAQALFDAGDFAAVADWPERVTGAAGLPLRPLAALRVLRSEPTDPEAALTRLLDLAVTRDPSIATPRILAEAEALAATDMECEMVLYQKERWREDELRRAAVERRLKTEGMPERDGWWAENSVRWWMMPRGGSLTLLTADEWSREMSERWRPHAEAWRAARELLPPGTELIQEFDGVPVIPPEAKFFTPSSGSTMLAERGAQGFLTSVIVTDTAAFNGTLNRRTLWLSGGAALLCAAAGGAVWQTRKSLRREIDLNEQKSNFVSSVSHELRAPLASLRVMTENMAEGHVSLPDARERYLPLMLEECRRLGSLIDNVLDFSRIERDRRFYHFEESDLAALVEDTVNLHRPAAARRGISLTVNLNPPPEPPALDGGAIQQALTNLLDNALKFSPSGTTVAVTLTPNGPGPRGWRLSVADEGPGVPVHERVRIFERFYRGGSELTRTAPGAGIGLSLVRHIVEAHGGTVHAEDAEHGKGAVFTILTPG